MQEELIKKVTDFIASFGPKVVASVIILVVGLWLIKKVTGLVRRYTRKNKTHPDLVRFLISLTEWALRIFLVITVLSQLGVATTSFVAVIGAAGLAIGLAMQGALANFAGGVLIMVFQPYVTGDLIEAQGVIGTVKDIQIFNTTILSAENKTVIIPNGLLSNNMIINYTREGSIRVDVLVGVSYDADLEETRKILLGVLGESRIARSPKPAVHVNELGDSSVNLVLRCWCAPADYWGVYYYIVENTKLELDKAGIDIPYPHQVVVQV